MRIFITGAQAFIGKHLHRRLVSDGHEVLAIRRHAAASAVAKSQDAGLRFVECDLLDYAGVEREIKNFRPQVVFHLASLRSNSAGDNDHLVLRTNVEATYELAKACAALPEKPRIVFTSAMGCYNYEQPDYLPVDEAHPLRPLDTYGLSKLLAEQACIFFNECNDLPLTILRISGVFGPGKRSGIVFNCLEAARQDGTIKVAGGRVTRDFVYVGDVVESLILSLNASIDRRPAIFNIGAGRGASLPEIIQIVERVTSKRIEVLHLPATQDSEFYFNIGKAERELGYHPQPLEKRIADFWQCLSEVTQND